MSDKDRLESILLSDDILLEINNNYLFLLDAIPELDSMVNFEHRNPGHDLDVWNHTLKAISMSPADLEIRFSLLLHDVGKPFCFVDGDVRHYSGHPGVSSNIARNILYRLGYEELFVDRVCYLVKYHDDFIRSVDVCFDGELSYKRYIIQYCDSFAHSPLVIDKKIKYLSKVKKLFD